MKKMKWALAFAGLLALGLASGCGDTAKPAPKAETPEKVLRVGTDIAYPPMEFKDEAGKVVGFEIDLAHAIADKMGAKLEIKDVTFSDLTQAAVDGKIDAIMADFEMTEERKKELTFSDPYIENPGYSILVKKDDTTIQDWKDLAGKVVGTQDGTRQTKESIDIGAERIHAFNQKENVLKGLQSGEVEAVVIDSPVARYYAGRKDSQFKIVGSEKPTGRPIAVAMKKGNTDLQKEINAALKALKEDGTIAKISDTWFGEQK